MGLLEQNMGKILQNIGIADISLSDPKNIGNKSQNAQIGL